MKRYLGLLMAVVLMLSPVTMWADTYTAGTYTGEAQGHNGKLKVEVTFSDGAITAIELGEHTESPGIADPAFERVPQAILEHQSLAVDTVANATVTSKAIIEAVADAVTKAGGDAEALRNKEVAQAQAGEAQEMTADIVVMGGGAAGLAAAVTAAEAGASVILIEKTPAYGGNTILSGGYMQAAEPEYAKTVEMTDGQRSEVERYIALEPKGERMAAWQATVREQYDAHVKAGNTWLFDSPELHMIQTYVGGDYVGNPELIEMMCKGDVDSMHWLADNGFNWKNNALAIVGSIWMRCHISADYASGQGFIAIISNMIKDKNLDVTTLFEVAGTKLITDDTGRVTGLIAQGSDGTPYTLNANKAVILASGGFGANVDMRVKYNTMWPSLDASVPTTNAASITGDGILMAQEVGANLIDMDQIQLLPIADPVTGRTNNVIGEGTNMYVNQLGKRFVNESERRDVLAKAILEQPGSYCYIISTFWNSRMDADYKNNYHLTLDEMLASGAVLEGKTLEELAEKMGVPADTFVETVNNFNKYAAESNDPEFGRMVFPANAALEMEGPFYACKRAPAVHHTMGGIEVNVHNQVLNTQGEVIPGLYAAGEVTGGFHGSNRLGGNALAEIVTTGRNAGSHAAQ